MSKVNSDNKSYFDENYWISFAEELVKELEKYRISWFKDFLSSTQKKAGQGRRILQDKSIIHNLAKLPTSTDRSTRAFQLFSCFKPLVFFDLIDDANFKQVRKILLNKIAPDDTPQCQGYFSRYWSQHAPKTAFCHDVIKDIVIKPLQEYIEQDKEVLIMIDEIMQFSWTTVFNIAKLRERKME
jgi:hypothetical protein